MTAKEAREVSEKFHLSNIWVIEIIREFSFESINEGIKDFASSGFFTYPVTGLMYRIEQFQASKKIDDESRNFLMNFYRDAFQKLGYEVVFTDKEDLLVLRW